MQRRTLLALALAAPTVARAQLPDRTIRLICPWAPGGTVDTYLRAMAAIATRYLGREIVVENRGGASGAVALGWLKSQRADGGIIAGVTEAAFRVAMVQPVQYEPLRDFDFVAGTYNSNSGWAVRRDSPVRSLGELVERARARPEALSYSGGGTPDNPPLGMKVLEHRADIRFLFVPFAGGGQMINALLGGTVDVTFDALGTLAGVIESGDVRLLAVASGERLARWPEVPTARELGFDAVHSTRTGFIAPRGLPPETIAALEHGLLSAVEDPEHDRLLHRLTLTPWRRDAVAFRDEVHAMFRDLPPLMRELGMPTRG
jgi:tripartite-type tricarboxylate transporter receptor subunit TctC